MGSTGVRTLRTDASRALVSTKLRIEFLPMVVALVVAFSPACGGGTSTSKVGSTLTIAEPLSPPSLDPATGANENSDYFNLAYDPLIILQPDGTFKPGLALKWSYAPGNKSFSITLRQGVRFSDGDTLDAAAVKGWLEHALSLPGGRATTYFSALKSIDVTGPLALTLNFSSPTPLLELAFSQLLEMGMIGGPKAVAANSLATDTDGAGPYMLDKASSVTGDHYTYVPNPNYWNKSSVYWKKVVLKTITNPNTTLDALRTGQVQVAVGQPVTSIDSAKSAGLKYVAPLTLLMGLSLNDRSGTIAKPLGDVRIRQAINYAIDRRAVANVIAAGYGRPTAQMAIHGDDSYDPALDNRYPYDVAKAKELLTAAGYPNGFSLAVDAANVVGEDTLGQALAGQLANVGIKVQLDVKSDVGVYFQSFGKYPVATLAFGRLPAAIDYQILYGPGASLFNPFKSTNAELSRLYEQLIAAPSDQAPSIARKMQQIVVEEAWFAPVLASPLVDLYRSEIAGVTSTDFRVQEYTTEIRPAG
jgi:peptide/nickel transport system substrate-binding protein